MKGVKTNQVVLNLGLGNNPYHMIEDITELINTTNFNTFTTSIKKVDSTYNGELESTLIINCICKSLDNSILDKSIIIEDIQKLCVLFTQERIAAKINGSVGLLIDHPFMNLNKMEFNEDYFIN